MTFYHPDTRRPKGTELKLGVRGVLRVWAVETLPGAPLIGCVTHS